MTSSTLVPRFTVEPQSSLVRTGSSVALTCAVEPPSDIRWTINGSAISTPAARRRGIELTRDGQLLIGAYNRLTTTSSSSSSSASAAAAAGRISHDGVYQCAAVTPAGGVIVSSEATLQTACTLRIFLCIPINVKGKASSLDIAPLTMLNSGALQPRKWQLTGNDCSTAAHALAAQSSR